MDVKAYAELWGPFPKIDAHELKKMLANGDTFCSVPALGDATSFRFAPTLEEVVARVSAPEATIVLYRDGKEVARGKGPELRLPGSPGVWRAEVLLDPGFPYPDETLWIFSSAYRL